MPIIAGTALIVLSGAAGWLAFMLELIFVVIWGFDGPRGSIVWSGWFWLCSWFVWLYLAAKATGLVMARLGDRASALSNLWVAISGMLAALHPLMASALSKAL